MGGCRIRDEGHCIATHLEKNLQKANQRCFVRFAVIDLGPYGFRRGEAEDAYSRMYTVVEEAQELGFMDDDSDDGSDVEEFEELAELSELHRNTVDFEQDDGDTNDGVDELIDADAAGAESYKVIVAFHFSFFLVWDWFRVKPFLTPAW